MINTETVVPEIDFEGGSYYKDYTFEAVDVLDKSYNVKLSINRRNSERYGARGNVFYIDGTPSPHQLSTFHKFYHEKLDTGPRGINPEQDKKWKKYNRNEVKIFNMYINRFMDYLGGVGYPYQQLYYYILDAGIDNRKWNLNAGCSMCKCSPGFKMKGNHIINHSFSLTFTDIKPQP
jgi:hypothetical protein